MKEQHNDKTVSLVLLHFWDIIMEMCVRLGFYETECALQAAQNLILPEDSYIILKEDE